MMTESAFLLEDKIEEIKAKFSLTNGWLKIYQSSTDKDDDSTGIYCCLIDNHFTDKFCSSYSWPLLKGREGKPSVYGDNTYKTYDEEGLEPFLFYKHFSLVETSINYIDISEEFILYFKLYEKSEDKQNRIFFYVDDYGELEEVLIVEPKTIRIKIKFLKEYISIREMTFLICYDFMRLVDKIPTEWNVPFKDELIEHSDYKYSHLIRNVIGKTQSWIIGKVFIKPNEIKKTHFSLDGQTYQDFILGYDESGELIFGNCADTDSNHFRVTYFKKSVLDKYYNDPEKYEIDGFNLSSKFFTLKIDNNMEDYVPVFLNDLRMLSESDQLHWKQYNIPPTDGMNISWTYYNTMINGNWAEEPEAVDLLFKSRYLEFNNRWEQRFGWQLYKPLSEKDEYLFTALHKITSNNVKAFCEQTSTIVKLMIDRLNEKELAKNLPSEPNQKGIAKLEKFLEGHGLSVPDLIVFLRNLQNLRSGLIAHSFSASNSDCQKAMAYFGFIEHPYQQLSKEIFVKSLRTINTLEAFFNLSPNKI